MLQRRWHCLAEICPTYAAPQPPISPVSHLRFAIFISGSIFIELLTGLSLQMFSIQSSVIGRYEELFKQGVSKIVGVTAPIARVTCRQMLFARQSCHSRECSLKQASPLPDTPGARRREWQVYNLLSEYHIVTRQVNSSELYMRRGLYHVQPRPAVSRVAVR